MTREGIIALCQQQVDAWNARDDDAIGRFYAEDATLSDAGGDTASGRHAIAARAKTYIDAFPDLRLDLESIAVDGNRFVVQWKASGTNTAPLMGMPATNKPVVVEGCDVGEVGEDGLVLRETDYWNEASFMRQLGLLPEPVATA